MPDPQPLHPLPERVIEHALFASRWLLAPIFLGLALALVGLLIKFVQHVIELMGHVLELSSDEAIIGALSLIDIALMGGLVLMVMFAAYENFVSKIDVGDHKDRPDWMGHLDFSDLKLKLMASIVAISAIHVLEDFMNIADVTDRELYWAVGIHLTFVVSGVLLGVMDRLTGKHS